MSKIGYPFTFHQSQTPPTVTDEEVEEVPIDTGLIRCICESTEDDGFTIQCDKCLTWQHAFCMNIKQDNIPDRYLCNDCVKVVASLNSQRSSKNNNNNTTQDIDTIGLIHTKSHSNNTTTTKRKEDKNKSGHNSNKSLSIKSNSHNKRSREMAVQEDYRSPIHTKTTTSKKPKLSKRITMSKRSLQQQQQQQNNMDSDDEEVVNKNIIDHTHNNNDNDSHQSDNTTLHVYQKPIKHHHHHHHHHNKKKEKHHHIDFNTISSKFVHEIMKDTIKRWSQSSKWKSQPWRDADQQDIATSSTSRKHQQQHHHHHPSNEPFIVMDTTSLQQSALNHISIQTLPKQQQLSSAYGHRTTSTSSSFSPLSSSRLRKGVFADTQLNANAFLMEVHGEILLKTEYKFDVANDYAILGTACAHVLFYPTLDLCIDSRQLGNDARYFRRSCHPNAELRTMVFPSSTSNDTTVTATSTLMDQGDHHKSIRLGVFTRTAINEGEEITLGWNWQKGHISWRKNVEWYRSSSQSDTTTTTQNRTFSHDTKEDSLQHYKYNQHKIDEKLELKSQYAIEQMIEKFDDEFGSCACGDRDVCLIEQLRLECFNYHHDKNIDMNLQANGSLSDNLELTSLQQHQETGKTLQHSRQIIVTPSNNNNNSNLYKMGNEKTTTATINSPALGSVEDNIDIDVTSMSPITRSPVLTNPILAQVKKAATLDGDDELDIDSDIDIGEEIPNTADAPMNKEKEKNEEGKKLSTGQAASPISSSSSGISDLESANSGSVGDDHNDSNKKRKLMVKSESKEDSHSNIVLWKKSMVTNKKPSVLPFKKAWSKNFSQRDLKLDNDTNKTSTLIVSDIKTQEKSYINNLTTKLDISSSSASYGSIPNQHNNNNNNNNNNSALMKSGPSSNNKTETDLDDGELSDASSASTIPLEEDDRNWSLRTTNHKLTTSGLNDQPDAITSVHKNNNSNNLESSSSSPSSPITTSVDTTNELQQHNNNNNNNSNNNKNNENSNNNNDITNAVVDKDSKNYISDTKSISPNNINDPSKNQPELVSSSLSSPPPSTVATTTTNISAVKNESSFSSTSPSPSVTHLEINDNKDVDQSKPTKVKVSLQEYLSRRLANQDPPSQ
ncbi:hypothetical protein BJ944DRAFT_264653 [Cunninghamella echinulata]|nr:hypothetical protein BJ944DRAFT_264653 [Cunninghamella echinulata]